MRELAWQEFGHGYNFTRECILSMDLDEMDRHIDWAKQRRRDIHAAQKQANKPPRK